MTAAALANLLHGQRSNRHQWMAHCPAHQDHSPSLSIRDGRDGRVLITCFAGCEKTAILKALGLTWRDLFNNAPMTRQQRAEARRIEKQREEEERLQAQRERRANSVYRRLICIVDVLALRLTALPDGEDGDVLTPIFHTACGWLHEAEMHLDIGPEALPSKQPFLLRNSPRVSLCSPFAEPHEERVEATRVQTMTQLHRYVDTGTADPAPFDGSVRKHSSAWHWVPLRPWDEAVGSALYEAALDTLEELDALRGFAHFRTKEKPVGSGLRRITGELV